MIRPTPGTIGLAKIPGPLGPVISVAQALAGDPSGWTHVFVVIDDDRVIQAMPSGAQYASLAFYLQAGRAVFLPGWPLLTHEQIAGVPAVAEQLIGTKYSFLDYLSLAAVGAGIRLPFTRRRVRSSGHMICSQLADELHLRLDSHLFDDGRMSMDVTPGDIHRQWTIQLSDRALELGFLPITAAALT